MVPLTRFALLALMGGCVSQQVKAKLSETLRDVNAVSDAPRQCTAESYNHTECCQGELAIPDNPQQVVALVRGAMDHHKRIHAVGHAHSGTRVICAEDGGIEVSTEKLNSVIYLERHRDIETVVVDAGVTMIELAEWLHHQNYSLGYHILEFRDATVGGVIGTAAHGSALNASSIPAEALESVWLVAPRDLAADKGQQAPKEYDKSEADEWLAMTANLGLLGVVTRVRLRVMPDFNVRLNVSYHYESDLLKKHGVADLLADCDFAQLNWFPRADRVMKTCGVATHDFAPAGMTNNLLNPRATTYYVDTFKGYLKTMAKQHGRFCTSETLRWWRLWWYPPIGSTRNSSTHRVCDAIGPSHQMMSSDLTKLQQRMPQTDLEIAVPISRADEVLKYVDDFVKPNHLCFPLVGIFLRFSKVTPDSLIAHSTMPGEQAVMFVELVIFQPSDAKLEENDDYYGPYLKLARDLIERFQGRAHWAKNSEQLFAAQLNNPQFCERVARFRAVAATLDPEHLFANAMTDRLELTKASSRPCAGRTPPGP
jgi:hypothetical protein